MMVSSLKNDHRTFYHLFLSLRPNLSFLEKKKFYTLNQNIREIPPEVSSVGGGDKRGGDGSPPSLPMRVREELHFLPGFLQALPQTCVGPLLKWSQDTAIPTPAASETWKM